MWRPFNIPTEEIPANNIPVEMPAAPENLPGDLTNMPGEFEFPGDLANVVPGDLIPGELSIMTDDDLLTKCDTCNKNFLNIHDMRICVPCVVEENKRLKTVIDNLLARETCKNCDRNDN